MNSFISLAKYHSQNPTTIVVNVNQITFFGNEYIEFDKHLNTEVHFVNGIVYVKETIKEIIELINYDTYKPFQPKGKK